MSEKTILPVQPASVQPLRATGTVCGFAVRPGLFLLNGATPVPGGVGPMTICCLMENTIECFLRRAGR